VHPYFKKRWIEAMTTNKTIGLMSVVCAVGVAWAGVAGAENGTVKKAVSKKAASKSSHVTSAKPATGRASIPLRSADPYLGAIVVDADTGKVLFENNADSAGFPASVIKLMDMMVIMDRIAAGQLSLSNSVTATAEATRVGGSQVYLAEHEVFSLEDMMYALMVKSANDVAMALAIQIGGSAAGFVEMMNRKAVELGMTHTTFYSPHGLPPNAGQKGDTSTARDLALLARALIAQHPEIFTYTSVQMRPFRDGKFIMQSHNHLLHDVAGCDGLKTGFISAGGFSIVATAKRDGRRVIAVVLGSKDRLVRDARAAELIAKGFAALPPLPPPVVVAAAATNLPPAPMMTEEPPSAEPHAGWLKAAGIGLLAGLAVLGIAALVMKSRRPRDF
jgi:D-alanyl-D-alanine carboxypeptidase (penicillin-binding protein 5/6)